MQEHQQLQTKRNSLLPFHSLFLPKQAFSSETRNLQDQKHSNFPAFFLWESWKESIQRFAFTKIPIFHGYVHFFLVFLFPISHEAFPSMRKYFKGLRRKEQFGLDSTQIPIKKAKTFHFSPPVLPSGEGLENPGDRGLRLHPLFAHLHVEQQLINEAWYNYIPPSCYRNLQQSLNEWG